MYFVHVLLKAKKNLKCAREAGTPIPKNPHTQYVLHTEEDTDRQ